MSEWTTTHQQPKIIVLIRSCKENHAGRKAGLVIDIAWPVVAWPVWRSRQHYITFCCYLQCFCSIRPLFVIICNVFVASDHFLLLFTTFSQHLATFCCYLQCVCGIGALFVVICNVFVPYGLLCQGAIDVKGKALDVDGKETLSDRRIIFLIRTFF